MNDRKMYKVVSDGKTMYLLGNEYPNIPKGLHKVYYIGGTKVYNDKGEILNKFMGFQKIRPNNSIKVLTRAVNYLINSGLYHANKKHCN